MEFRVLDEVVEIEGTGLLLFGVEEDCQMLYNGCRIRDSRGNIHTIERVSVQEGLSSLLIRGGNADYFRRLFRNVFVDATLFVLEDPEEQP